MGHSVSLALRSLSRIADELLQVTNRSADGGEKSIYLVGGVVRDAILDRPLYDLDVACSCDPRIIARAWARHKNGSVFMLSEKFACWRVNWHEGDQQMQLDACPLVGASIDVDLANRDFTCNALAYECIHDGSIIIDRHGGVDDIDNGVLRMVSPEAFIRDPLRMVRGVRFASEIGFTIDPSTIDEIRRSSSLVSQASGERVFAEIERMLLSPDPVKAIEMFRDVGLAQILVPQISDEAGGKARGAAVLQATHRILASLTGHDFDLLALLLGAYLDAPSPAEISAFCKRMMTSNEVRSAIEKIVGGSQMIIDGAAEPTDKKSIWDFLCATRPYSREALVLASAQCAFELIGSEVWDSAINEHLKGTAAPLLDGAEIMSYCDLKPGPIVGVIARELAFAQFCSEVSDRDEAIAFVRARSVAHKKT